VLRAALCVALGGLALLTAWCHGVPIDRFSLLKLRGLMTAAFQDPARYNLTVRENVCLGDTEVPPDEARLVRAAELAGADPVVSRLPGGTSALLGHWLEGGHELSVGEWQRIALARTLWRDAWLVILDEPTSSMDAEAEARGAADQPPLLDGPPGRPDLRDGGRSRDRRRPPRGPHGAWGPVRAPLRAAGAALRLSAAASRPCTRPVPRG
jgi:hypothetical protein